ncbi:hypothetical protein ACH4CE_17710 [Streptomyces gelaticus]
MEAFPGRWVGGVAMVLGPLLMPAGRHLHAIDLAAALSLTTVYVGFAA